MLPAVQHGLEFLVAKMCQCGVLRCCVPQHRAAIQNSAHLFADGGQTIMYARHFADLLAVCAIC